jgi:hypothetical protein
LDTSNIANETQFEALLLEVYGRDDVVNVDDEPEELRPKTH